MVNVKQTLPLFYIPTRSYNTTRYFSHQPLSTRNFFRIVQKSRYERAFIVHTINLWSTNLSIINLVNIFFTWINKLSLGKLIADCLISWITLLASPNMCLWWLLASITLCSSLSVRACCRALLIATHWLHILWLEYLDIRMCGNVLSTLLEEKYLVKFS